MLCVCPLAHFAGDRPHGDGPAMPAPPRPTAGSFQSRRRCRNGGVELGAKRKYGTRGESGVSNFEAQGRLRLGGCQYSRTVVGQFLSMDNVSAQGDAAK